MLQPQLVQAPAHWSVVLPEREEVDKAAAHNTQQWHVAELPGPERTEHCCTGSAANLGERIAGRAANFQPLVRIAEHESEGPVPFAAWFAEEGSGPEVYSAVYSGCTESIAAAELELE